MLNICQIYCYLSEVIKFTNNNLKLFTTFKAKKSSDSTLKLKYQRSSQRNWTFCTEWDGSLAYEKDSDNINKSYFWKFHLKLCDMKLLVCKLLPNPTRHWHGSLIIIEDCPLSRFLCFQGRLFMLSYQITGPFNSNFRCVLITFLTKVKHQQDEKHYVKGSCPWMVVSLSKINVLLFSGVF